MNPTQSTYDDMTCLRLTRECPRIRISRPAPLDNTEHVERFPKDGREGPVLVEEAKVVLCFDCQQPIPAGMGVQVRRHLRVGDSSYASVPTDAVVHTRCNNEDPYVAVANALRPRLA